MKWTHWKLAAAVMVAFQAASGCSSSEDPNTAGTSSAASGGAGAGQGGQGGQGGAGTSAGGGGAQPCTDPSACPGTDDDCRKRNCEGGLCGEDLTADGTPIARQVAEDCLVVTCDGEGATKSVPDDADTLDDDNPCTLDACDAGTPTNTPLSAGTPCSSGGVVCDGLGACVECVSGADCTSGVCTANVCIPPDCMDGVENGNETDMDCGGDACAPCADGLGCAAGTDCTSGVCDAATSTCAPASCADGAQNQDETDADCGGLTCGPCGPGLGCTLDSDCIGGSCSGAVCLPTCNDSAKNQDETGIDCGGLVCGDCANGGGCLGASDCTSHFCSGLTCAACFTNGQCAANEYCAAGVCVADLGVGLACGADGECLTGQCEDGLCCATDCSGACLACAAAKTGGADGTCATILVGTDPDSECAAGGCTSGTCNGSGACGVLAAGTTCGSALSCSGTTQTNQDTCNAGGTCIDAGTLNCAPYACGATTCKTSCVTGSDCAAGIFCVAGVCQSTLPQGAACAANANCASNACVDGVCCGSSCVGTCLACSGAKTGGADGTCGPVLDNTDPDSECTNGIACQTGLCNGAGACGNSAGGTACGSNASCVGGLQTNQDQCNGLGVCADNGVTGCGNYVCGPSACLSSCTLDTDCVSGNFCSAGACIPKLLQGSVCANSGQCSAGACVDGFCCNSACSGTCQACSAAKTGSPNGTCASVAVGSDPDNECTATSCTTGTCNGVGACGNTAAGTACGGATSCNSGVVTLQDSCDGLGLCADAGTQSCGNYACSGIACGTTCTINAQCTAGFVCNYLQGLCVTQFCGDGVVSGTEACDDGNVTSYDGCSTLCAVEANAKCLGSPSVCSFSSETKCNDGLDDDADGSTDCADPNCAFACDTVNFGTCAAGDTLVTGAVTNPKRSYDLVTPMSPLDVALTGSVTKAAVKFTILHTFDSELDIALVAPSGQSLDISSDNGGGGDNYVSTILSDACATSVTAGASPFTGCFKPETAFSTLTSGAKGTWNLAFGDDGSLETGLLVDWTLALCVHPTGNVCGNGVLNGAEVCDDGNNGSNDGCNATCTATEAGFTCGAGAPTVCTPICGNGVVSGAKDCEDGNVVNGDGCSSTCLIEPGYACFGTPSTCVRVCGDGVKTSDEGCDDGNRIPGDGCDQGCGVESALTELEPNDSFANADTNAAAGFVIGSASTMITAAVPVIGDRDYYKVVVPTTRTLRFEVFDPTGVGCTVNTPTTMWLFNSAQAPLYVDNTSGFGSCSAFTVTLTAGSYYVMVEEFQNNGTLPGGYRLQVRVETPFGAEAETNDTTATANTVVGNDILEAGSHLVATDVDHFKLVVGAFTEIRAEIIEGAAESCESNEVDSKLSLLNSAGVVVTTDDDGGRGKCSLLEGQAATEVLVPGVYYLKVESTSTVAVSTNQFDYQTVISLR